MTDEKTIPRPDLRPAAASILSQRYGDKVSLDDGEALRGRDNIARFRVLDAPASVPPSVVVKASRNWNDQQYDPDAESPPAPSWNLFADWASLQLIEDVAPGAGLAPRFYGGDRARGVFVEEDLGDAVSVDADLLAADAVAATEALLEIARRLGQLHAATIERAPVFEARRGVLGPWRQGSPSYRDWADPLGPIADQLGIALGPAVAADLEAVVATLENPGPFAALTHGDPCPDNWLRAKGRLCLIDFEAADYRHALLDGVYGRIHFPTCWCVNRIPTDVWRRMDDAYRAELRRGCPAAADEMLYRRGVAASCAFHALTTWRWSRLQELFDKDQTWGISTLRQRVVVRAALVAQQTEELGELEALGAAFGRLGTVLRQRWASDTDEMPEYPAFRR